MDRLLKLIALAVLLIFAMPALTPTLIEVAVTVKDAGGHSINDLKQGDFEVYVDGKQTPVRWWMSARDMSRHTVYTIRFADANSPRQQKARHSISITIGRDAAVPEYPRTLTY